ncbi:DUF4238 domain-containing protein [Mesorhizobium sp. B2-8-9]|uniref:DUF4238 domain-containing protein n=1 Tax=Mesorhizobium sp. B2-8-9 TaxID=2589899 RepID=UPI00112A654F|nr:DUF4238 domain-containing protein [Mesorhizobium sp. B2-8-9]TPI66761.1 DUF4238 domain-containing protein [Mesorhizobium sp. B2-8-9]
MDHHFLAQFHLRRWANGNGRVLQWGRIAHTGKIVSKEVAPAATAYGPGLYALKGVPDAKTNVVEERLLGDIDNRAAPILEQLIDKGVQSLNARNRFDWARYLNASAARVPKVIAEANSKAASLLGRKLSEGGAEMEWMFDDPSGPLVNLGIVAMSRFFFTYHKPTRRFLSLRWFVRDVSGSKEALMIGDDPLGRTGNLYEAGCLITLPLSANRLFIATDSPSVAAQVREASDQEVVEAANRQSLINAKQFAYGVADRDMVDEYLLTSLKK